jgi:hypothetical protein
MVEAKSIVIQMMQWIVRLIPEGMFQAEPLFLYFHQMKEDLQLRFVGLG